MNNKNSKNEFSSIYVKTENVSCEGASKNSKHPLVYLNVASKGRVRCPYCSTEYIYQGKNSA